MNTPFLSFATRRYLRQVSGRREGSKFLRFVTVVAIGGIAVGVAALLLALAIVRGFSSEIESKIVGFGAHIQIESLRDGPIENAPEVKRIVLDEVEGVTHVQSYVEEFGLLRARKGEADGIRLSGTEELPGFVAENIVTGENMFTDRNGLPSIIIGQTLADELNLAVGDVVTVFSLRSSEAGSTSSFPIPRVQQFHVAGVFQTALADYDEVVAFTDQSSARRLFKYNSNEATRIDVTVDDREESAEIAAAIEDRLGFPLMARTIYEVFQSIFAWVRLQESIIPVVIAVIVLVAAFNVIGTMLMILLEKTNDVGVLMSIGASPGTVRKLFMWLGLGLGVIGTATGSIIALIMALIQKRFGIIPLPAESYYMDTAPVELAFLDFVIVAAIALLLCTIAAYVPARVASKIQPVAVIRFH